jgi:DNA-binding CsgD family transcriptional regulator
VVPFLNPEIDALLEATVLPALVLSVDAVVLCANRSGKALAELHPAMRIEEGRFELRRAEEESALTDALRRMLVDCDAERIVLLLRARRGRPTLLLRLAAMRTARISAVLLEVSALDVALDDATNLANIFGLTRTQAVVTSWLARGLSVPEIAIEMGVKETTLRTHIREACERLDLNGQLQLALWVSQVARLTGLFSHRPEA